MNVLAFLLILVKLGFLMFTFSNNLLRIRKVPIACGIFLSLCIEIANRSGIKFPTIYICVLAVIVFLFSFKSIGAKENGLFVFVIALDISINECLQIVYDFTEKNILLDIVSLLVSVFLWVCIKKIFKKKMDANNRAVLQRMYILSLILLIELLIAISLLDFAKGFVDDNRFSSFSILICAVTFFTIFTLVLIIFYVRKSNNILESDFLLEQEMNRMQRLYYEMALEKEESTKKFRHDFQNHLLCLMELSKKNDYKKVESYLDNMQKEMLNIGAYLYDTGNHILDVLLAYYSTKISGAVRIDVIGKVFFEIDDLKACTIFSNLIQNAVEELNREPESVKDRFLKIKLKNTDDYAVIEITNSANGKKNLQVLKTEKNEINHGYGIQNVQNTIYNLGGKLKFDSSDDYFSVVVMIKAI